ncbi:MAG TPA: hypothetical protein VG889_17240 [Rhizomicrobium sp.]|nr:hypothetical protein [Rhizomicrobium sp.]
MRYAPLLLAAIVGFGLTGCDRHPARNARDTVRAERTERGDRPAGMGHGLRRACREDIEQYCVASQRGRERRQCLESHMDKLSADCKQALAERHGGRRGGWRNGNAGGNATKTNDDSD